MYDHILSAVSANIILFQYTPYLLLVILPKGTIFLIYFIFVYLFLIILFQYFIKLTTQASGGVMTLIINSQ